MYDEKKTQNMIRKLDETSLGLINEYLKKKEHVPGDLAVKLLNSVINGWDLPSEQVNTVSAAGEPYQDSLPGLLQEENQETDFDDSQTAGKLREPLLAADNDSLSQTEIVRQLVDACEGDAEVAAKLKEFMNKHLL
jgi:hypothetical protein